VVESLKQRRIVLSTLGGKETHRESAKIKEGTEHRKLRNERERNKAR
jgi:hypothetical protein